MSALRGSNFTYGKPQPLFDAGHLFGTVRSFDISPDGKRVPDAQERRRLR
jgi:hypothetical protein